MHCNTNMGSLKVLFIRKIFNTKNLLYESFITRIFQIYSSDDVFFLLQVDFANKKIGGGVLRGGRVQEEVRFCICPELLISLLIMDHMDPNEAIIITVRKEGEGGREGEGEREYTLYAYTLQI